jgi:hypothetical protein
MQRSKRLTRWALLLATLPLGACATFMPGQTSGEPATSSGAKRAYPPIRYNSYCEAQRGIAEFNSRRDGKVYKAPCDLEPKPKAKPVQQEPTTA